VIIGTATLVAEECPIHPRLKQSLIDATELDTMVIMRTIQNSHRVWINDTAKKIADMEKQQAGLQAIVEAAGGEKAKRMYEEGDLQAGVISCGQGVGLVRKVMPMKDIIEGIIQQASGLRQKLGSM
jgi:NAD(P)H-dependent flavin oxidoreductase YrpB (nitropropane dioxygenase family)